MVIQVIPLRRLPFGMMFFDYECKDLISPGQIVSIFFGKKRCLALVWNSSPTSTFKGTIKSIEKIITPHPLLTQKEMAFGKWLSHIYRVPIGVIFTMLLPPLQARELTKIPSCIQRISRGSTQEVKLITYGDLSSAFSYIKKVVNESKHSVCILVPLAENIPHLKELLPSALIFESADSQKTKRDVWKKIRSGEKCVVIGTRSAVFLPFSESTTFIIQDEEHEGHKQWEGQPLYRVHDVITYLHHTFFASIHYLSRTPQVSSLLKIPPADRIPLVEDNVAHTNVLFVAMGNERKAKNFSMLCAPSTELCKEIQSDGGNVVFLGNRKGYAYVVECPECFNVVCCPDCFLPLTVLTDLLQCRFCNRTHTLAITCSQCGAATIRFKAGGNEMLEESLRVTYPTSTIIRYEAGSNPEILDNLTSAIVISTDAILPHLKRCNPKLITVIDADALIRIPDYHNVERTLSRLVGLQYFVREHKECMLIVQTHIPKSELMRAAQSLRFGAFYKAEKEVRKTLHLPPYSFLIKINLESSDASKVAEKLSIELRGKGLELMMYPLLPERVGPNERYALLIKADPEKWEEQCALISPLLPTYARIDINPISVI